MKYTDLQTQLENIKSAINNENDDTKLKQLLREKLNEIGILIYEYTSFMLTTVDSGKKKEKNQAKNPRVTNIGVVTNHNCPDPAKNPDILFDSQTRIGDFKIQNLTDLNSIVGDVMNH
jgi:hypothetical protein